MYKKNSKPIISNIFNPSPLGQCFFLYLHICFSLDNFDKPIGSCYVDQPFFHFMGHLAKEEEFRISPNYWGVWW